MLGTSTTEAAGDPVYRAIKARVIAYEFPQGKRIIMRRLADELGISTWPVLDAMKRLAAEGLVIKAPHKGFIAMTLSADTVLAQYELTRLQLSRGLERLEPAALDKLSEYEPIAAVLNGLNRRLLSDVNTLVIYTCEIFYRIALLNGNSELVHAIERANNHLYYIRTLECQHLEHVQTELKCFCELLLAGQCWDLISAIKDYHDQRVSLLPTLFPRLRPPDENGYF